jgi:hypothetical protein
MVGIAARAPAQAATVYPQWYLPGAFDWRFDATHTASARLFYAFDYGHAILYETLFRRPGAPPDILERDQFAFLVDTLLRHPPRVPLAERPIAPEYAKLAPEAMAMFDWAHELHRQIYDVWSDERLGPAERDARVADLLRYYRSRRDLALSARPKSMELMEGQRYSLVFRRGYPKFNGLIWAYHWLQVGLYDALLAGATPAARDSLVHATTARFWAMLEDPPRRMPQMMPMAAAVAPRFSERYPEAAVIFDNLHAMHDVISDILADPAIPRSAKRAAILAAAARYRDDTTAVESMDEWRAMARDMGAGAMGGVAVP